MKIRLDKYLAEMGRGTRSEVKIYIRKCRVTVNGNICRSAETKVDTQTDKVQMDGKEIIYRHFVYYMLNKPAGVVSATEDGRSRTVLDLLGDGRRDALFPVGRLDKDTEGLLLLTNDGALAHELLSPKKHVDKTYFARVAGWLTPEDSGHFAEGMLVPPLEECKSDNGFTALPAGLNILKAGDISEAVVTLREGKYHQIKRMFSVLGKEVEYLKRLSMGPLVLDESLPSGTYRELTEEEYRRLRNL